MYAPKDSLARLSYSKGVERRPFSHRRRRREDQFSRRRNISGGLRVPKGWRQRSQVIEWGREAVPLQPPWVFNQLIHFSLGGSPASIEPLFFLYYAVDTVRRIEIERDTFGIQNIDALDPTFRSCTIDFLIFMISFLLRLLSSLSFFPCIFYSFFIYIC